MKSTPDDSDLRRVASAFLDSSHLFISPAGLRADLVDARTKLDRFVIRFWPVLRHYRPEIVGQCLALSYDDPELGRRSQLHGFGMDMKAGDHPQDRDSSLGSYRDDGSYLALQAFDYFDGIPE